MQPITENKHVDWRPSSQSENDIWFRRTTLPHFYASNEGPGWRQWRPRLKGIVDKNFRFQSRNDKTCLRTEKKAILSPEKSTTMTGIAFSCFLSLSLIC